MKLRTNLLPMVILLVVAACASLTPAQKTLWALNVYEAQYNDYLRKVINPELPDSLKEDLRNNPKEITDEHIDPNLTNDQKKILRVKRDILVELKPLIDIASEYQTTGQLPSDDIQNQLTDLINRLVELSGD